MERDTNVIDLWNRRPETGPKPDPVKEDGPKGPEAYHFLRPRPSVQNIVPKGWGKEEFLVNEPEYAAKLLYIGKGGATSLHFHRDKLETFVVQRGVLVVKLGLQEELRHVLIPGMALDLPRSVPHRLCAPQSDVVLLEVSTFHSDEDSIRVAP